MMGDDVTNTLIMFGISTIAALIQAVFWRWVSNLSDAQQNTHRQISIIKDKVNDLQAEIYRDYPSKADVHRDSERIMQSLSDIKTQLEKVNDKLDKKVDKL